MAKSEKWWVVTGTHTGMLPWTARSFRRAAIDAFLWSWGGEWDSHKKRGYRVVPIRVTPITKRRPK